MPRFFVTHSQNFIITGNFTEGLARSSIVLAKLDLYVRAGILDDSISIIERDDIDDLKKLFSIVPIDEFSPKKRIFVKQVGWQHTAYSFFQAPMRTA